MITLIRKYLQRFRYSVWLLKGTEKHSNADLHLLYVGNNKPNKNYIANLVYKPPFHETYIGRFWLLKPQRFKHKLVNKIEMRITEMRKNHVNNAENNSFFIPCWIDGKINIDETLRLTETNENIKSDMRRIRKFQYTYEVTREKEKFVEFYNQMYVPYIKNTYGKEALYHSLEGILKRFDYSELLLIKDGQAPVSGEVIIYEKHGPKLLCLGVLNGDRRYVRAGAIAALFYFRLLYLKSKGYTEIDLGASRVFLNDGVLNYKKKWGMYLTKLRGNGFLIHQLTLKTGIKSFLINNPFINSEADGFSSVYFSDKNMTITKRQEKRITNAFNAHGIRKLIVYQLDTDCPNMSFSNNSPMPIEIRRLNNLKNNAIANSRIKPFSVEKTSPKNGLHIMKLIERIKKEDNCVRFRQR